MSIAEAIVKAVALIKFEVFGYALLPGF